MTLEELWQLFPIILKEHDPEYARWYREERESLEAALGERGIYRLHHIGSSAVPGLVAKPTVDILLETRLPADELKARLEDAGWGLMAEHYEPELRLSFNKGYTPKGYADRVFHLHARRPCDPPEPYFRDWLIAHPETAREYESLKLSLWDAFRHNRDGYTEAKTDFVREITERARREYPGRYSPEGECPDSLDRNMNME